MTTRQTQNICITLVQRRPNVFDVGPTLYKCYTNVLCLLGTLCFNQSVFYCDLMPTMWLSLTECHIVVEKSVIYNAAPCRYKEH